MEDPIARFRRWYAEAEEEGVAQHDAMALATSDRRGRPSVRLVLLKQADRRGFVFYTNARSRKGGEIATNPHVAAVFYWHQTGRQVRIEGSVDEVAREEADAYWATRPRESNLGAVLSEQSAPMSSTRAFLAAYRALERSLRGGPVPRPRHWTGFRIVPSSIEFWTRGDYRLHRRELFTRMRAGWRRTLLQP